MLQGLVFSVKYAIESYKTLLFKQQEKLEKDPDDFKVADIELILNMYNCFPEDEKTPKVVGAYEVVLQIAYDKGIV